MSATHPVGHSWHDTLLDVTFTVESHLGYDQEEGDDLYLVTSSDGIKSPVRMFKQALPPDLRGGA